MRHLSGIEQFLGLLRTDPWASVRRPGRHTDEALTGTAHRWLRRLPARLRPNQLCRQFPRLANQIAWHWGDPEHTRALIEELLVDRRGGRVGCPSAVVLELRRLRDFTGRAAEDDATPAYLRLLQRFWHRH